MGNKASKGYVRRAVEENSQNIASALSYRIDGLKVIGEQLVVETHGIRHDLTEYKGLFDQIASEHAQNLTLISGTLLPQVSHKLDGLSEQSSQIDQHLGFVESGVEVLKSDSSQIKAHSQAIISSVNEVLTGMQRQDDSLMKNFQQLLENAQMSLAIQEAVNRNFQYAQTSQRSLLDQFSQTERSLAEIQSSLDTTLTTIKIVKEDILTKLDSIVHQLKDEITQNRFDPITSSIKNSVDQFLIGEEQLKSLSGFELIVKIKSENGILATMKAATASNMDSSLNARLKSILMNNYALPGSSGDERALVMLGYLLYGLHNFCLYPANLILKYDLLAMYAYQGNDLQQYNTYLIEKRLYFTDFTLILLGRNNENGLIDQVLQVLEKIQRLEHIKSERKDILQLSVKHAASLMIVKANLHALGNLLEGHHLQEKELLGRTISEPDFEVSQVATPIGSWRPDAEVQYAVQFLDEEGGGALSRIGEWSPAVSVQETACPLVTVPVDPHGRLRRVYRKFDDRSPQLVATLRNDNQTEFRDINRDLFNAAGKSKKKQSYQECETFLRNGADLSTQFERGRVALHAAAEANNLPIVKLLLEKGAQIDEQDGSGSTGLHLAVQKGRHLIIQFLLRNGADINVKNSLGMTALHLAVAKQSPAIIRILLANRQLLINGKNTDGFTALHLAALSGNRAIVALLTADARISLEAQSKTLLTPLHLAAGYDHDGVVRHLLATGSLKVNEKGVNGYTALHVACKEGSTKVVRLLLTNEKVDVNAKTVDGFTPLHIALQNQKSDIVRQLLGHASINVNAEGGKSRLTALHLAANWGEQELVKELLGKGANWEALASKDMSPLHVAVENARINVAEILLEKGSNALASTEFGAIPLHYLAYSGSVNVPDMFLNTTVIDRKDIFETTPLYVAYKYNNTVLAKTLLQHSANVHLRLSDYQTQLHFAATNGDQTAVEHFLTHGIPVDGVDLTLGQPLHYATSSGHTAVVRLLLEKGASVTVRDSEQRAPLHRVLEIADESVAMEIATLFLAKQADINSPGGRNNLTLLHLACQKGKLAFVQFLLQKGANVNIVLVGAPTPLQLAAEGNHLKIVQLLIEKGAQLERANSEGQTALHYAIKGNGALPLVQFLVEKGADVLSKDTAQLTYLDYALKEAKMDIVLFLAEKQVASQEPENGWTLLHQAAKKGSVDLVAFLIKRGFSVYARNFEGRTPLHVAVEGHANMEVLRYLLKMNAYVATADKAGSTLVLTASQVKYPEAVQLFGRKVSRSILVAANVHGQTPLYWASAHGDIELARWLLDTDASNLEQADTDGKTALQMAIQSPTASLEMVQLLVERGANLQTTDKTGKTLPTVAAKAGKLDVLKYLVESKGVDAKTTTDETGQTALHYAAAGGEADLVEFLLNIGAIVDAKDEDGRTPLQHGILGKGDLSLIRLFTLHKATLTTTDDEGNTLLDSALAKGKMDIAVFLAENSANESAQMRHDWTLFHYVAASSNQTAESNLKTLKRLFELDQNFDLPDEDGQTPLAIAIKQSGQLEVVQFLSEKGANVRSVDSYGSTLAFEAAAANKLKVIQYLASQGVDLQQANDARLTPLHVAAENGHLQVVKYLVGVNWENCFTADSKGRLPVQVAYANTQREVVQFFLSATNEVTGTTMMHAFAEKGELKQIKELIKYGAKVDVVDKAGSSLLHVAARYNQLSVLQYLITEKCFAFDRTNQAGKTAFDIADEGENEVIIEFLQLTKKLRSTIEKGNLELVKSLAEQNAGLHCRNAKGWTSLHHAAASGQLPIVQYLIGKGLKTTHTTDKGEKAYDLAKASGKKAASVEAYLRGLSEALWQTVEESKAKEMVGLLEKGADANFADAKGWTAVHRAASAVKLDIVKLLIEHGGDTLARTNTGQTAIDLIQAISRADIVAVLKGTEEGNLFNAIKARNLDRVKKIHRQRDILDGNFVTQDGWLGLHSAAYYGQLEMVKYFLEFGADPMAKTYMGETALDLAKRNDKADVVAYFVKTANVHGWTLLHLAAAKNDLTLVRSILGTAVVNVDAANEQGDTPLMVAIKGSGNLEMIQLLVQHQVNIQSANKAQSTALLEAIGQEKGDIVRYLLDSGANLDVIDGQGWSALHFAANNCDRRLITRLLKMRAPIDRQTSDGLTPLHVALSQGKCPLSIIVLFVANGASVATVDNNHATLVFSATLADRPEIVEFLLEEGADFRAAETEGGQTPLHAAAQLGLDHLVSLLLNRDVDALAVNTQGETALHLALLYDRIVKKGVLQRNPVLGFLVNAKYGNKQTSLLHEAALKGDLPIVRELVHRGAAVNEVNANESLLPLHCAVQGNNLEVVQYLVRNGANTCAVNGQGKTALGMALDLNRPKIAAYLKDQAKTIFFKAIEFGSLTLVADLLRKGIGHSCGNADGELPVHVASRAGQLAMLQLLKEQGADLEAITLDRKTPFDIARKHQQVVVMEYLRKVATNRDLTATELHDAAQSGNLPKMRQLLRQGVEVNNEIDRQTMLTPLHLAAENGHLEAVKLLLENGAMVNAASSEGKTVLHLAIKGSGTMEMVKYLVEKGARVSVADSGHLTPLIEAALCEKLEIIDYLLAKGASVQETTKEGFTALHAAASKGNLSIIDYLLSNGAQVDAVDARGRSALRIAIESTTDDEQLIKIIERLIAANVNLNSTDDNGTSLLMSALALNRFLIATMLLDAKVKVNTANAKGWTALHEAVAKGDILLVEKILVKGGEINAREAQGVTPLRVAVRSTTVSSPTLIPLLIKRGGNVKAVDNRGATVLFDAVQKSPQLVSQLLTAGVNVNAQDIDGSTALHEAARYGQLPVIKQLLASGANVSARNSRGQTAVQVAIVNGKATQQVLIQFEVKGASMQTLDDEDRSLVLDAAQQSQLDTLQYLESKGGSLREGNKDGTRPLHIAAKLGNLEMVQYLLEKGVPVNAMQSNHWTALHLAVAGGHLEVVKYLMKKGADFEMQTDTKETALDLAANRKQFLIAKELTRIEGIVKVAEEPIRRKRAIENEGNAQVEPPSSTVNSADSPSWLRTFTSRFLNFSNSAHPLPSPKQTTFPSAPTFHSDSFNLTSSLFLVDLLVRKITGERYYRSAKLPIVSEAEARGAALTLAFEFEFILQKTGEKLGLQLEKGRIDKFALFQKLEASFQSGNLTQIPIILSSTARNAYKREKEGQLWERTVKEAILQLLRQSQMDLPNVQLIDSSRNAQAEYTNAAIQEPLNRTTNLLAPNSVISKIN